MSNITELPVQSNSNEAFFPTYYYADTDEVAIPRLPVDPDIAAAVIASWIRLLVLYKVLSPTDAVETAVKAAGKKGEI